MVLLAAADPTVEVMTPVLYRVLSRARETADTVTLELEPVGEALAVPAPGQFNMMYSLGVGEVPISVSGWSGDGRILHTVRAVGAISEALCGLQPGGLVGLRGPFGTTWGAEKAVGGDVVVVAGGIGLAPLRPAVNELIVHRDRYRRAALLVGARSPEEIIFTEELAGWRSDAVIEVMVTVDAATTEWKGDVGVVTTLFDRLSLDPEVTTALVCGPEIMMRFAAAGLMARGVSAERVIVSMERSMQCGIGRCGHCQLGPYFICTDGPVFPWSEMAPLLARREL
ncbi:MAG TPA: FAD/NAD(P)-binding protein [Candidatus Binatia bacterium]|nr:FAD/NAD(P)-binding protein [Candidatus Binatia bacterium]